MSCCIKAHTQQDAKILGPTWLVQRYRLPKRGCLKENLTGLNKPETNKAGCFFWGEVCLGGLVDYSHDYIDLMGPRSTIVAYMG